MLLIRCFVSFLIFLISLYAWRSFTVDFFRVRFDRKNPESCEQSITTSSANAHQEFHSPCPSFIMLNWDVRPWEWKSSLLSIIRCSANFLLIAAWNSSLYRIGLTRIVVTNNRPIPLGMRSDASAQVAGRLSSSQILFTVVCDSPERSLPEICDFTIVQGKDVNSSELHKWVLYQSSFWPRHNKILNY